MASLEFVALAAGNVSDQVGFGVAPKLNQRLSICRCHWDLHEKFDLLIDGSVCGELWRTLWMDCGGTSGLILTAGTNPRPQEEKVVYLW